MDALNKIRSEIEAQTEAHAKTKAILEASAYEAFEIEMKSKLSVIEDMVARTEASRDLTSVEGDEWFHRFARVDFSKLIDVDDTFLVDLLAQYFSDHYSAYVNIKDDCLTMWEGPALIINDDGDIYDQDSGKFVIDSDDYGTDEERNVLIEAWMNKTGYFPSVIRVDRYGNASYVNTTRAA